MAHDKTIWYLSLRFYLNSLAGIAATFYSCSSPDVAVNDTVAPEIEILEPVRNAVYKPADTVFIRGFLSDENLEKGSVHIHDLFLPAERDTVFIYEFDAKENFLVDTFFVVNDALDKNYVIYIDAVDRSENFSEKQRSFYLYH